MGAILPGRKLKVILPPQLKHTKQCGIYKLIIGTHFYIGKSKRIFDRAKMHKYENEALLRRYGKYPSLMPKEHYKFKLFHHLILNPSIDVLEFQIIKLCKPEDLYKHEKKQLDFHEGDPLFLNVPVFMDRMAFDEDGEPFLIQ